MDEERAFVFDEGKAAFDPSAHGKPARVQKLGGFRDCVAPMDFDATQIIAPRHESPAVLDERANVLDSPRGHAATELHGLGETAILDARPPCRAADGDRAVGGEDRGEADEAALWEDADYGSRRPAPARSSVQRS